MKSTETRQEAVSSASLLEQKSRDGLSQARHNSVLTDLGLSQVPNLSPDPNPDPDPNPEPSIKSQIISICHVCLQAFPHPAHLPSNHPVVPLMANVNSNPLNPDLLLVQQTKWMSPIFAKTRAGNPSVTGSDWGASRLADGSGHGRSSFTCNHSVADLNTSNMGDQLPLFPKAESLFIHSGNIINWNRLKKKPNQTSTEEVCECIAKILGAFLEAEDKTKLQYETEIYKVNSENIQKLDENEREEVKITVKVFICRTQPTTVIGEAVKKVLHELGTNYVETLLLAVGPHVGDDNDDDDASSAAILNVVKPYWEAMEELVAANKVLSLGICDLTKDVLEDLYNWAKVKPSVDQVNLESCCVMPQDLTQYAKSVNVQLLTHNDKPDFIPEEILQETIASVSTELDGFHWTPQWVVRYSGILKCRGIISLKGYICHAQRRNSKLIL